MIDKKKLDKIKNDIISKFPEFKGVAPKIVEKAIPYQGGVYKKLAIGMPTQKKRIISMQFTKTIKTADAVEIERHLIITMDENGKIVKVTQSR